MVVLVICKNENIIKNKSTRVFETLYIEFLAAQWQVNP